MGLHFRKKHSQIRKLKAIFETHKMAPQVKVLAVSPDDLTSIL